MTTAWFKIYGWPGVNVRILFRVSLKFIIYKL